MMHGKGVLQKVEGGKYRGEFWNGLRSGVGSEVENHFYFSLFFILFYFSLFILK